MPAVSVVIPLFQTERFIAATLASVLAQTFKDFEVIVIDDGSTDRGPAIARATGDARVRVITQDNRGLAGARNAGIAHARAPLIALLDADDLWTPHKLERHVAHLTAEPAIGVSFSHSLLIDDSGHSLDLFQTPNGRAIDAAELMCSNPIGNGSAPVIRREVFDAIAIHDNERGRTCWFDESFRQSEDIECWVRIAATTPWRFGAVAEPLTLYRIVSTGLSADVEKQLGTWLRFRAKLKTYAPELEARAGDRAQAYQYRYLARRCVRSGAGSKAARLIAKAMAMHPRLVLEEPTRTLTTAAAAIALAALPKSLFDRIQDRAVSLARATPGLRV